MSESDDANDIDRLEQELQWTLSKVERDVQDAVRQAGNGVDPQLLMDQLDGDVEELEQALGGLRSVLQRRAAQQPIALHLAVAAALDLVLGQLETPLSITSAVPADLPIPAMRRADLVSLCERAMRLVTRVAGAGDELRIVAKEHEGDLVDFEIGLRPFEPERLPRVLAELQRSSESLVDFVADHGGRMAVDEGGTATLRLALPRVIARA